MTKKAWGLCIVPGCMILYLLWMAFEYNHVFAMSDTTRWVFIIPPIIFSCALAVVMVMVGKKFLAIKISLTPTHLAYEGHTEQDQLMVPWKSLIYTPPGGGQNMVRTLQVASRERSVSIYDIFTPQFELLCKEVAKRKTNSISADSMGNLVIDSGRLGKI